MENPIKPPFSYGFPMVFQKKMAPKQSMNLPRNHQSGYAAPHVGCAAGRSHRGGGEVCLVATKAHLGGFFGASGGLFFGDEDGDYHRKTIGQP